MTPTSPIFSGALSQTGPGTAGKKEIEIVVMPEKFQGAALSLPVPAVATSAPVAAPVPRPIPRPIESPRSVEVHHSPWPMIIAIVVLLLIVGGVFAFLNRDMLFKQPTPAVITPPKIVITPPTAPANLLATTTGLAIALSWVDAANNETGYRMERREGDTGTYIPLNSLGANSTAFLDVSVEPGKTYTYRVSAINEGGESSPSNEASARVASSKPTESLAPQLPPGGLDSDSDGLSDVEETRIYATDPKRPDTDSDGFLDGNEVFHLYNPAAKAPVRLLDSGLVQVFSAPAGWSLYIPTPWKGALDTADGSLASIKTETAETFQISLEDNPKKEPLLTWYLARNPGVVSTSLRSITTKGGLEGLLGTDRVDAYFAWDGKIFSLRYQLNGQSYVNYRTTFEMMLNSLKLIGAPILTTGAPPASSGPGTLIGTSTTSSMETGGLISTSSTSVTSSQP